MERFGEKMKTRSGFVSNSSSSSFIVTFPHKPESPEDVFSMLFGHTRFDYGTEAGMDEYGDDYVTFTEISDRVFNDIAKSDDTAAECRIRDEFERLVTNSLFCSYDSTGIITSDDIEKYRQLNDYKDNAWSRYHKIPKENEAARKEIDEEIKSIYDKEDQLAKDIIAREYPKFLEKFKVDGTWTGIFTYSDESGENTLEPGGIFDAIPNVRISHH
jgi:hypothetical protein